MLGSLLPEHYAGDDRDVKVLAAGVAGGGQLERRS
jgi:hypothetical protein